MRACCIKSFRDQITVGKEYLVLEVLANLRVQRSSYRVVDNDGCPAIYEASMFNLISNRLTEHCVVIRDAGVIVTPLLIGKSPLNAKHVDGFWGLYFDEDPEAIDLLKEVIDKFSGESTGT